ncbi:recombinase family protein [Agrobacterium salinitolerans]|uniref:Recombinase family protein n=1 Tax=Agrobacterium salinitolerans TaxID=1183413 RepID=A0A9X3KL39_9HYPH|nr:recombinase family protein [Agrobacterium salinitolerans]MCZ7936660.1 recombinase family protein [Agrobacterium salinitolerans]
MRYVAYYRVSTQMQGKSGLGLEAQRAAVQQFTSGQEIVAEFTEIESGKRDDRPELEKALDLAKQQNAVLVIAKLDRLSRDVHFISGLLKRNVPIKACDMPHADNFQFHIMAAVAEKEREMISQRTKDAIAAKRARGHEWGTNAVRVEQAKVFAQSIQADIQTLMDSGITTPAAIANALNERAVRTSRGTQWGSGQVVRLLRRLGQK